MNGNFTLKIYYNEIIESNLTGESDSLNLAGMTTTAPLTVSCLGIPVTGTVTLYAKADPHENVVESNETNNEGNVDIEVVVLTGWLTIVSPMSNQELKAKTTEFVAGYANTTQTVLQVLQNIDVTLELRDSSGNVLQMRTSKTSSAGYFSVTDFEIPETPDGDYTICASTDYGAIPEECVSVTIVSDEVDITWLIILIIVIIIVVALIATVLYLRWKGLGKMVECGECGALIPGGSKKCPKCGVEFEEETVKCSKCGAWIPADVKNCPECGAEFVVGEVKAEDYQKKMRAQYDEYADKHREKAEKALGAGYTDKQFMAWWAKQPSFITFEQWLKDEEEKKRLGSSPCQICGTLNSVTATICHRCGTPLKKDEKPKAPPPEAPKVPPKAVPPPAAPAAAPAAVPPPVAPVPKKVIKKPMEKVVPKKVASKRPLEPGEE